MADLNALIAQGAQFQAPQDPFAQYAKMQQLQQAQQMNMLNQMKMQEYQRSVEEQNRLRALDPTSADYETQLFKVKPELGIQYRKEQAATAASKALEAKNIAAAAGERQKMLGQAMRDISANPSDAQIAAHNEDVQASALFSAEEKARVARTASTLLAMPYDQRKITMMQQGATAGEMKPTITPQTLGGTVQAISTPAFGGPATVVPGSVSNVTMTPFQEAEIKNQKGQLAVAQGHLKVAQDRLARETTQLDPVEQQILAKAVAEGRVDINKVNGRNAKIYVGALQAQPGVDLREMSFENVASAAGARSLGVQSAKMQTAAAEADKMIDVVRNTSAAVDRTQFPTINAIENAVSKGTGGREIVQLNTAINSLVNSYARAISPTGQPTVSDKNHAREVINSAYSNGQIEAITDIMRQEMSIAKGSTKEAEAAAKAGRQKTPPAPAGGRPSLDSIFGTK